MNKSLFLLLAVVFIACTNSNDKKSTSQDKKKSSQALKSQHYSVYDLPSELDEISGITFLNDSIFAAIEDEDGILYYYNLKQQRIIKKQRFGEPDDYEDLVLVENDMYIMTSKGIIYHLVNFNSDKPIIKTIKTPLTGKNNIEGLAYDAKNHRLLLAAKDKGLDKDETTKEIYAYDLNTQTFQPKPAYTIRISEIEEYFKGDAIEESSKKFLKVLGNENMNKVFRTSSITIKPSTNEVYVLSSINNLIVILSPKGDIARIITYGGKEFIQPEGIAFSHKEELYVSNEGKGGKANIILLTYDK